MTRQADLIAAIAKQKAAIERLKAVKKRTLSQTNALVTNFETVVRYQDELLGLADTTESPTPSPTASYTAPPDYPESDKRRSSVVFAEWFDAFKAAVVGDATSFDNAVLWAAADEAQRRALVGSGRFGLPTENPEIKDWSGYTDVYDVNGITYVYLHGVLLGSTPTGPLPEGVHGKSLTYAASLGIHL